MVRTSVCAVTMAALSLGLAIGQSSSPAVVAIASGPTLTLYDASGDVVRHIDLKHPVAGFALSPDRSQLVIVSPDTEHGGTLFLVDLRTGKRKTLTDGPFAFSQLNPGEKEVYDSPALSPDGQSLAFAVHGNQPGDGNDAEENSGPLAVLDLKTGKPHVLEATNHIPDESDGPCSESDPQWSPDGRWILFNCEVDAFLTDSQGGTIRDLKLEADSAAVGWVGTRCILYAQVTENQGRFDFEHESLRLLNLTSGRITDGAALLDGLSDSGGGLRRASKDALVKVRWPRMTIETRTKRWELQLQNGSQEPQIADGQLLTGWQPSSIPAECK